MLALFAFSFATLQIAHNFEGIHSLVAEVGVGHLIRCLREQNSNCVDFDLLTEPSRKLVDSLVEQVKANIGKPRSSHATEMQQLAMEILQNPDKYDLRACPRTPVLLKRDGQSDEEKKAGKLNADGLEAGKPEADGLEAGKLKAVHNTDPTITAVPQGARPRRQSRRPRIRFKKPSFCDVVAGLFVALVVAVPQVLIGISSYYLHGDIVKAPIARNYLSNRCDWKAVCVDGGELPEHYYKDPNTGVVVYSKKEVQYVNPKSGDIKHVELQIAIENGRCQLENNKDGTRDTCGMYYAFMNDSPYIWSMGLVFGIIFDIILICVGLCSLST
eukprot:NODE_105_length_19900_cov_0.306550.p4 type:complete len:329 gc:universal NODE_105_length_19900_cov_0.306550:1723-2709(+)